MGPNIWNLQNLMYWCNRNQTEIRPGVWVPSRPIGLDTINNRIYAAWLVFTGAADALVWPNSVDFYEVE